MEKAELINKFTQIKEICERYLKDHPPLEIETKSVDFLRTEIQNTLDESEMSVKNRCQYGLYMSYILEDNESALDVLSKLNHISSNGRIAPSQTEGFDIIMNLCQTCIIQMNIYEYEEAIEKGTKSLDSLKQCVSSHLAECKDEESSQLIDEMIKVF